MAASLQTHHYHLHLRRCVSSPTPKHQNHLAPKFSRRFPTSFYGKAKVFTFIENGKGRDGIKSFCCLYKAGSEIDKVSADEGSERPPFDINLAVILAGFAFEAYSTPSVMSPNPNSLFFSLADIWFHKGSSFVFVQKK